MLRILLVNTINLLRLGVCVCVCVCVRACAVWCGVVCVYDLICLTLILSCVGVCPVRLCA